MTKYERIKAMSVEELSKFIKDVMLSRICLELNCDKFGDTCSVCIKQWLESEVENCE